MHIHLLLLDYSCYTYAHILPPILLLYISSCLPSLLSHSHLYHSCYIHIASLDQEQQQEEEEEEEEQEEEEEDNDDNKTSSKKADKDKKSLVLKDKQRAERLLKIIEKNNGLLTQSQLTTTTDAVDDDGSGDEDEEDGSSQASSDSSDGGQDAFKTTTTDDADCEGEEGDDKSKTALSNTPAHTSPSQQSKALPLLSLPKPPVVTKTYGRLSLLQTRDDEEEEEEVDAGQPSKISTARSLESYSAVDSSASSSSESSPRHHMPLDDCTTPLDFNSTAATTATMLHAQETTTTTAVALTTATATAATAGLPSRPKHSAYRQMVEEEERLSRKERVRLH